MLNPVDDEEIMRGLFFNVFEGSIVAQTRAGLEIDVATEIADDTRTEGVS